MPKQERQGNPAGLVSAADMILSTRRMRFVATLVLALNMVLWAACYAMLIAPAFAPPTLANAAVRDMVTATSYQDGLRSTFASFYAYNRWPAGTPKPDVTNFVAVVGSPLTVTVSALVRPVEETKVAASGETVSTGFRFDADYRVDVALPGLIVFLLIECLLVAAIVYVRLIYHSKDEKAFDERVLTDHFNRALGVRESDVGYLKTIKDALFGFHQFCLLLSGRKRGRADFQVNDEYDVQDLLLPILRHAFADVRPEESSPSRAGSNSRIDFLIPAHEVAIEVKYVGSRGQDARLGDEMATDVVRYWAHPDCKHIVFFIYDPGMHMDNPGALASTFQSDDPGRRVDVVVSPRR